MIRSIGASVEGWAYRGYFADVPQDAWYAPYVELLFELGVTTGYADGTYRPGRGITRAEMAVLLARAFSLPLNAASAVLFEDVPEGSWFAPHVGALLDSGVTKGCGVSPSLYCPNEPVPRDQMGSFLARILGLTP